MTLTSPPTHQSPLHIPQVAVVQSTSGSVFSGVSTGTPPPPIHLHRPQRASTVISGTGDDIAMGLQMTLAANGRGKDSARAWRSD
ncbi:hypothetical protein M422DRAFT_28341 [Sphaerobolus stellatus SS14]|nr:hypothetical protein M422DRAFT_28341 [Sphaerobolus stellatus SS14]